MKSEQEIQDLIDKASDMIGKGKNPYHGMTYIEGIRAALEWAIESDSESESPLE